MCTIIGSSGRDCVLIILFHLDGFLKVIYGWVNMTPTPPQPIILEELIKYAYKLIQFFKQPI